MSEYDINYALTELKEQHPWLRNYHSRTLQMVGKQVVVARKTATGKLSYRKEEDFNAFTYNQSGFRLENNMISLSKIGNIKIVLHRQPANIKQVTVCRENGRWYAVVACEVLRKQYSTTIYNKPVGIDMGITKFAHDSDNHVVENPQFLTKMLKPVRRAFLERLQVLNMTRNHRLARRILDASWSTFKIICKYKVNRVVEVEPAYSSTDCSRCGHPFPKSLAVRTHVCPKCGAVLDRDYNSARNHPQNGLELL